MKEMQLFVGESLVVEVAEFLETNCREQSKYRKEERESRFGNFPRTNGGFWQIGRLILL